MDILKLTRKAVKKIVFMILSTLAIIMFSSIQTEATEKTVIDPLIEYKLEKGIRNMYPHSLMLVKEGVKEMKVGNTEEANRIFEKAKKLSPDLPQIYYYLSIANLSLSPNGLFTFWHYLSMMFKAISHNFWWSFYISAFVVLSLVITIYASVIIFTALIIYSKYPLYLHELMEDWRNIFLLIPSVILLIIGPVFALLGLFFPFWNFMEKKQRILFFIYSLLIALLILSSPVIAMFLGAPNNQSFKNIVMITEGIYTGSDFKISDKDGQWESIFALALKQKRDGFYNEALHNFQKLLKTKQDVRVYNNIGNCYVGLGNYKQALKYYNKALKKERNATVLYNKSQVLRENFKFKEGEKYYNEALKEDPQLFETFNIIEGASINRLIVDEGLKRSELWSIAFRWVPYYGSTNELKKWITYRNTTFSILLLITLLIFIYLFGNYKKTDTYRCRRCGSIYCGHCEKKIFRNVKLFSEDVCLLCYKTLVRLTEMSPKSRIERLLSIQKYKDIKKLRFKILEIFLPGSGHLFYGWSIYGLVMLSLFLYFLFCGLLTLSSTPFPTLSLVVSFFRWISIIGLIVTYTLSIIISIRRSAKTWL